MAGFSTEVHRPRNVDWKRAAALLYGDWGTSKAYVIGLAFVAAGFGSLPMIIAVCALTGLVGINYAIVCRYFPDGGGVYSAAREQSRALAVLGALLLVADLTVTAAMSGFDALRYLGVPSAWTPWGTILAIFLFGFLNSYGPKHSGALAMALAAPTVVVVFILVAISLPHLTTTELRPMGETFGEAWMSFVSVILALSGVEAIANLTGVLKADPDSPPGHPTVRRESKKAIFPVALEVTIGTTLLGWAMLSMPRILEPELRAHYEDMLKYLADYYGTLTVNPAFGHAFSFVVGIVIALLLLSAVNTCIAALIGLLYTLARDGEMPPSFLKLNHQGVPKFPLAVAIGLPVVVLLLTVPNPQGALHMLADLYAIGVVGAISVNLGCCTFNQKLPLKVWERSLFATTFVILFGVEVTLAAEKHWALFFVVIVVSVGFFLRTLSHKASGLQTLTVSRAVAEVVSAESIERLRPRLEEGQRIMVAVRGITPVLRFALEEAEIRKATLCILYVKELNVLTTIGPSGHGRSRWQDDPEAAAIMSLVLKTGEDRGVSVLPVYAVSSEPASTILDLAATLGIDYLFLGASQRLSMAKLLKGNVVERVAAGLPEEINLVIYG